MMYLKGFNEGIDSDFESDVRNVFSYVIDSNESNITINRIYGDILITFLFYFHNNYKDEVEYLKFEIEECLDKLSITRDFYYKFSYGVRGGDGGGRPIYCITLNDGSDQSVYKNIHLQDYKYMRKI